MKNTLLVTALAGAVLLSSRAHAQTFAPSGSTFVVGAGIGVVPEYAGSDKTHVIPALTADYQNANGFFAGVQRGVGYAMTLDRLTLSGAIGFDPGRDDKRSTFFGGSNDLKGMGKIDKGAVAKLQARYNFGWAAIDAGADLAASGHDHGNTYRLSAVVPLFADAGNRVAATVGAKYADDKHMQTYFGVTPTQSSDSGYRRYDARAGIESTSAMVNWRHIVDARWSVNASAGVTHLMNDAADSPIVKRTTTPMLIVVAQYSFR